LGLTRQGALRQSTCRMHVRPAILRGALRGVAAVALVASALGVEWAERPSDLQRSDAGHVPTRRPQQWVFGVDGWVIQVDSVDVALPTETDAVASLTA